MITVKDLKSTNTRDSHKNTIRKAWSLQISEQAKLKLKSLPQETRFELYNTLDEETRLLYIQLMQKHREESIANGAKLVFEHGLYVLENKFRIDTDELLIEAGLTVALTLEDM